MDTVKENRNDKVEGYIVKLYKKMFNAPKKATIRDAMFMTWMNFDCMDIMKVSGFREFNKSLIPSELKEREKYESRQKLFLYPISKTQEFLLDGQGLEELPLITLSIMDVRCHTTQNFAERRKHLCECLKDDLKGREGVCGDIYGSLSIYECVLVLRGNSYEELARMILDYQKSLLRHGIIINKTYTIAGINLRYLSFWKPEPDSEVSIRVSCSTRIDSQYLRKSKAIKDALKPGYRIFSVMGKYDFDIIGKINSLDAFVELFLDNGALSPANTDIHKTNTRFMSLETDGLNGETKDLQNDPEKKDVGEIDSELDCYISNYTELEGLSSSIRESLLRLILRLYQARITVSHDGIKNDLKNILDSFLEFLRIHQYENERQDEFGCMINCLNLLLDNRISACIPEFETPQNVLRYSGTSLRVLLAYADFVKRLFSILQTYKEQNHQILRYVPLVTTDTGAKITATVYLSYCTAYRFININIPVDLLFEVQDVLPWLTHEVGHFIRAGWRRSERNEAYFWSVSRVINYMLEPYKVKEVNNQLGSSGKMQVSDGSEGEKFDAYREYVCQFFQNIIYRFVFEYNRKIQIPYNQARSLFDKTREITDILQKVYEESIADIFMIQVLEIDSLTEYLQIQSAYYRHINMEKVILPLANISRIMSVSIVIAGLDMMDYKGIRGYFENFYKECQCEELKPIAEQLSRYRSYYMIENLVVFLNEKVKEGLNNTIKDKNISRICERLRKTYRSLRSERFEAFLGFVEEESL